MKILRLALPLFFFISILVLTVIINRGEQKVRVVKDDLVELSLIKYGLFSVDEWKLVAAGIIAGKIDELELSGENKAAMRQKISAFLYDLIEDFERRFYEERSRSLKGILQSGIASLTGTFNTLKQDVPVFTEQIIGFLDDPQSKKALRSYLVDQMDKYTVETFAEMDYTLHDRIIASYGYNNRTDTITGLKGEISNLQKAVQPFKIALISMVLMSVLLFVLRRNPSKTDFLIFSGISVILLVPGVTLPMIGIDARISFLSFSLLGEPVSFSDQILFYQSKSILEVVSIMFEHGGFDMNVVGFLILAFSVLFPAAKLTATAFYIFSERLRNLGFIRILVFRTGKWSMADVMVIAIFMAFIGFNGIVSGQLGQIESLASSVEVLTTNHSGILAGFFFFTGFVLMSLMISQKLHVSTQI
jgi:hypothetical protein